MRALWPNDSDCAGGVAFGGGTRRVVVAIVYALGGAFACSVPSVIAAQQQSTCCANRGFNHSSHRRPTPEDQDKAAVAASAAAAKAMADSIAAECARRKQALTAKLNALGAAWVQAVVDNDEQLANTLGREYLDALSDWDYLKVDCKGVGDPPPRPRVPTIPGGAHSSNGGAPAGGGGGGGGGGGSSGGSGGSAGSIGGGGRSPGDSAPQKMYDMLALWSLTGDSTAPKAGVLIPSLGQRFQRSVDSTLQAISNVRPTSDYAQTANFPSAVTFAVDAHASPADSATSAVLGALASEQASLITLTQSYARFLGARDAHDIPAMLRQALVMLGFADSALSQAHSAAARRRSLFALGIAMLDRIDSLRRARHRTWDEVIAVQRRGGTSARATEAAKVLQRAGMPDSQVEAAVKAMQVPKGQAVIATAHTEARADSVVRSRLDSMHSSANWPSSDDEAQLDHARALALGAVLQADSAKMLTSPDSSTASGVTSNAAASSGRKSAMWVAGFALLALGAFGAGRIVRQRRANFG